MSDYSDYWEARRAERTRARTKGLVMIRYVMSRIQVSVPYCEAFIVGAHQLGGRWRPRSQVWSFPDRVNKELRELISHIYGESVIKTEKEIQ